MKPLTTLYFTARGLETFACVFLVLAATTLMDQSHHRSTTPVLQVDKSRLEVGEAGLRELESKASHSPCWRDAVSQLDSSCKQLNDIQQSRLAVAFANCHLAKSGRQTYPCTDAMTILECTEGMDTDAYQTYTHFFTHTSHICYFLQIELWQGRTEGLIGRLADTSSEAVQKLEQSLDYHRVLDDKQDRALRNQDAILEQDRKIAGSLAETHRDMEASFGEMTVMAEQQKALLGEMFGSLQSSVEAVRSLMSLLLVEFIGWETVALFCVSWLVVLLLPQFNYSRFKMVMVLLGEVAVEVCVRRLYGYIVMGRETPPPNLTDLHSLLWACRYVCAALSLLVYVWEWYHYQDYGERNYRLLSEIRQLLRTGRESSLHHSGSSSSEQNIGRTTGKAPIPLPYVPLSSVQPTVAHDYPPFPPPTPSDHPDSPDSTESNSHSAHHSHHHTAHHHTPHDYMVSSDDEMMTSSLAPDNDRALQRKKVSQPARGQRSSQRKSGNHVVGHHHHSPSPSPSPFLAAADDDEVSSGDEGLPDNSLTRTAIHRHLQSTYSELLQKSGVTSSSSTGGSAGSGGRSLRKHSARKAGDDGNIPFSPDPEPEKEVVEEKDVPSPGRRRSLRSSEQPTEQSLSLLAPPTPAPPLPPPSSTPRRLRQTRSATPAPVESHRYYLRQRTPRKS